MSEKTVGECPACDGPMRTIDSRGSEVPHVLRRRVKRCKSCGYKCTTHEVIVVDTEGYANSQQRTAREFVDAVDALARQHFGTNGHWLTSKTRLAADPDRET